MLTNDRLWKLDAAKTGPKCQNGRQVKLANRVRAAIRKGPKTALPDETIYIASDTLNMHSFGRVFKD